MSQNEKYLFDIASKFRMNSTLFTRLYYFKLVTPFAHDCSNLKDEKFYLVDFLFIFVYF